MEVVTAKTALERLANIADTAANLLQASAPTTSDRFKNDARVAREGLEHLAVLTALLHRAADALDDYHRDDEQTQGPSPLAAELRAALTPPPSWVNQPVQGSRADCPACRASRNPCQRHR